MFRQANSNTVLMAAIVSAVGIFGMVFALSEGGLQGAQVWVFPKMEDTLAGKTGLAAEIWPKYEEANQYGNEASAQCLEKIPYEDVARCCKYTCASMCGAKLDIDLCLEKCANRCQNTASQTMGIQLRTR